MRILRIAIVANLHPAYYTPGAVLSIPVHVAQMILKQRSTNRYQEYPYRTEEELRQRQVKKLAPGDRASKWSGARLFTM